MRVALTISVLLFLSLSQTVKAQQSLYTDIKARHVGDVITVVLMENISGSSSTNSNTKSNTDGSGSVSATGNFIPIKPELSSSAKLDYNSNENITADQSQLLHGNMSVRIKKVSDNGDLVVSGERMTQINGSVYQISLSGVIRPNDINTDNQIPSYKVADAKITYRKKEGIRKGFHNPGTFRRILFSALGIIAGAVIINKAMNK